MTAERDAQRRMIAYWDSTATTYDQERGHALRSAAERDAWLAALRALLPLPPADLLDVGTGTGFLALLAAEMGYTATGVDLSEEMLALARRKAAALASPPRFLAGDAAEPPLPPASFDVVVNRHLLWTLPDPARAFRGWRRLLRDGGRVVIIDGLWWRCGRTDEDDPGHQGWLRYYTPEVQAALPLMYAESLQPVLDALTEAGFTDARVSDLAEVERIEWGAPAAEGEEPRYVISAVAR